MRKILKLSGLIKAYWGYAFLNILLNVMAMLFSLISLSFIIPFLRLLFDQVKRVDQAVPFSMTTEALTHNFNYFLSQIIQAQGKAKALVYIAIAVIVLFFFRNLTRYLALYLVTPLRTGVIRDLRNSLFNKILILPLSYFSSQRKGDILSRMANDVNDVEWSVMNAITMIFRDPINILLYLAVMLIISPWLTLVVALLLPLSALLINWTGKRLNQYAMKGQKRLGRLIAAIEESLHGLKIIKAYNKIDLMDARFRERNQFYARMMNRVYRYRDLSHPITEFLSIAILVIIIWIGGSLILSQHSKLTPDIFLFFLAVFSQIIPPAKNLITAYYYIEKGLASYDRIESVLMAEEVIMEDPKAIQALSLKHQLEYKNVSFRYEKEPVLQHIDFSLGKGKKLAIVGPSGAGKSTLIDLLPRFYDCTEGEILLDGIPIKQLIISSLRDRIGMVGQESILFNDTVFNNIAFGLRGVGEEAVADAARKAQAHDFILSMEKGYQSLVGDQGVKLSGGQRQRISIARAILRDPDILILDEATSELDTESERLVQIALKAALENRTAIIIAHRLSTVQMADEILVMQQGMIVERGDHRYLYDKGGFYRKLCDQQFSV